MPSPGAFREMKQILKINHINTHEKEIMIKEMGSRTISESPAFNVSISSFACHIAPQIPSIAKM